MTVTIIDKGWNATNKRISNMDGDFVKIGYPSAGTVGEPLSAGSGHDPYENIPDVAIIAFWNEFGTEKIDERATLRPAFDNNLLMLDKLKNRLYKQVTLGKISSKTAMKIIGEKFVSIVRNNIRELKSPENADSTIAQKGSDNPLIDTAQMVQSVQYTVNK